MRGSWLCSGARLFHIERRQYSFQSRKGHSFYKGRAYISSFVLTEASENVYSFIGRARFVFGVPVARLLFSKTSHSPPPPPWCQVVSRCTDSTLCFWTVVELQKSGLITSSWSQQITVTVAIIVSSKGMLFPWPISRVLHGPSMTHISCKCHHVDSLSSWALKDM